MKKRILPFVAVAVLFGAIGVYVGSGKFASAPATTNAVEQMFAQTMNDAAGKPEALSKWKGKALVVNFWATWCAPCVEEMPELTALQRELTPKNIQIIGIGIDTPSNIAEFSSKYKISYPLYVSGMNGTELSRQFGNQAGGLPFTVLIDADGRIRKTYLGRLKLDELRKDLSSL
jgi:thiol-disulfide isomerase/thioredoxin